MNNKLRVLSRNDPTLGDVISTVGILDLSKREGSLLGSVCRIIVGQQLSAKAARTIWGRIDKKVECWTAENLLTFQVSNLREAGLSTQKSKYIMELAERISNDDLNFDDIYKISVDEARAFLVDIKGFGEWSADMFLIFALGKEDIFSDKDVALKRAIQDCYCLDGAAYLEKVDEITNGWRPYRSIASRYLWAWLDMN